MTNSDELWIGQNGKRYGPYTEVAVRQWMTEGKFATDALAWREGMPEWTPLSSLFPPPLSRQPPPRSEPDFRPTESAYATDSFSSNIYAQVDDSDRDRTELPAPPSLHWGLVVLFTMVTFGIFGCVWPFIQASWIRKIDSRSNGRSLLIWAFIAFVVGEILAISGSVAQRTGAPGTVLMVSTVGGMLVLAYVVLYLVAYFSMAGSLRRALAPYGLPVAIGGVTLFFFNMYYLQGQLRWIARWKVTGQTVPKAPKATLWLLFGIPFFIAILAAIAIPAYQNYVVRSQVAEGLVLAGQAKAVFTGYYVNRHAVPADNAAAGLGAMQGRYVSSVDVSGGMITVSFATGNSSGMIRNDVLVLTPTLDAGRITWSCNTQTTVPNSFLPVACRR